MLVDNAIVILENIYRKREEGLPARQAAVEGAQEVTGAIVAGTLTTIAVFAPVVFLAGFAGIFFAEMAMVVVFSLMCSLVVAVTLVPSLAARLLDHRFLSDRQRSAWSPVAERIGAGLLALERAYTRVLRVVLQARWLGVAIACVVLLLAIRLLPLVQLELMPETDEGVVDLDFELPVG